MKKTSLFDILSNRNIQVLNTAQLHVFKGGCTDGGGGGLPSATPIDEEEGNQCNSGGNNFIPPPGT